MPINMHDLNTLLAEANELSSKPSFTKAEQRRFAFVQSAIAAVRQGASLAEIEEADLNERKMQVGLNLNVRTLSHEQRADAKVWQRFLQTGDIEARDQGVGNGTPAYLKGNMGSFVPLRFFDGIFAAQKYADALFDPNVVTFETSVNGQPLEVPMYGDTEEVATLVGEADSLSEADLTAPSAIMVGNPMYSFKSPLWHVSMEAMQDVEALGGILPLFQKFSADRIARGVGPYLVNGTGTNQPMGLLTALEALGSAAVTAVGSSGNDGSANTGANSIGSADIANLFYALDTAYREQPKCVWLMNSNTLLALALIVTKQGVPLVQWQGPEAWILGKRVRICPSLPNIASKVAGTIVFGDASYFMVRAVPQNVRVYKEAPGLVENGKYGLRAFARYDSQLIWNDVDSPAPLVYLQQHS
jgi:HK97 family phage major capsid protein